MEPVQRIQSKTKKYTLLFLIVLITGLVVIGYNFILKNNIKAGIFHYLTPNDSLNINKQIGSEGRLEEATLIKASNHSDKLADEKIEKLDERSNLKSEDVKNIIEGNVEAEQANNKAVERAPAIKEIQKEEVISNDKISIQQYFLAHLNSLTLSFFQDKPYTQDIAKLKKIIITDNNEVNNILNMLEEYNSNYLVKSIKPTKQFIISKKHFLNKFIKVEKINQKMKDKNELKEKIVKNLDHLGNFINSNKFQNIFLNNN